MLKDFGLIHPNEDISWIDARATAPDFVDLSADIVGGAGQTFVLSATPGPQDGSLMLIWNGVVLTEGVAFTRSGVTVTMAEGYEPSTGDTLVAYVWGTSI